MLHHIHHRTRYVYDHPQRRITQSLRLTPAASSSQRIVEWGIAVEGAQLGARFVDGAGDTNTTLTLAGSVSELDILVTGTVETSDTNGILQNHTERVKPAIYLRQTRLTAADHALHALAAQLKQSHKPASLELAHAMSHSISEAIAYQPGTTHHDITASEALAQGAGVCQDHTHALIAIARANGYPARYVVGYLHSDADGQSHEASHAWCEIHINELGWVGFDPTNRCCPDARYVRLCSGLDAHDAAPIRGVSVGAGREIMDISVSVGTGQQ